MIFGDPAYDISDSYEILSGIFYELGTAQPNRRFTSKKSNKIINNKEC